MSTALEKWMEAMGPIVVFVLNHENRIQSGTKVLTNIQSRNTCTGHVRNIHCSEVALRSSFFCFCKWGRAALCNGAGLHQGSNSGAKKVEGCENRVGSLPCRQFVKVSLGWVCS